MTYYIKEKQLKSNLKKYNITTYDDEVLDSINKLHHKVVADLLQQKKKQQVKVKKHQKGGRVAFPIDYFGGTTNNLSSDVPAFTNVSGNDVSIRQEMLLNDPSQVLGTDKAMTSGMIGGKGVKFNVSKSATQEAVKSLSRRENVELLDKNDKERFVKVSKQKFETVMDEVLMKAKKQESDKGHLSKSSLTKVLEQKKYKAFKA
jgi:hypothetical protein